MSEPAKSRKRKSRAKPPEQHKKAGRPTQYRAQYATIAFGFAVAGYTDAEMAKYFGVSESTLNLWKQKHPKFSESIKSGKEPANGQVAVSLHKMATGYERIEEEVRSDSDGNPEVVKVRKFYPPIPTAAIFMLKNRLPDRWRDKHEQVVSDPNGAGVFDVLAVEIAKQLAKDNEKAA